MKRVKIATMVMTFFILFIGISGTAFGATTYTTKDRVKESDNLFKFWTAAAEADNNVNGDGHTTEDWTRNHYSFTNLGNVFCVDPGTDYAEGVKYEAVSESVTSGGKYTTANAYSAKNRLIISWLIGQTVNGDLNFQYVQAAIWVQVTGEITGLNKGDEGTDADITKVKNLLEEAKEAYSDSNGEYIVDGSLCQPSFSTSTLSFTYDSSLDAYVSNSVKLTVYGNASSTVSISGAPSGSYMLVGSSDKGTSYTQTVTTGVTIKVVVPRESISGSEEITLKATGKGTNVYVYTGATIYMPTSDNDWDNLGKYGSDYKAEQVLATANYTKESGSTVTATGTVETGNLKLGKLDTYGKYVAGATYKVTGPNGFTQTITTTSSTTTISGVPVGEYTITETKAPTNMILNSTSVTATVKADKTVTSTITNKYQRGSVNITKYSSLNTRALGDSTLAGATFSLYAAEDIYEGETLVYSSGKLVKSNITTDANGNTTSVDNLPLGKYYYVETDPSTGFLINDTKVYVTLVYAGQTASVAAEVSATIPETQIFNYIEINKQIGETSNTEQAPLDSCEFTVILKQYVDEYGSFEEALKHTDEYSEYEWSTITIGSDGYGISGKLAYGEYVVSETTVSPISLKCADFIIFVEEDYTVHDPYTVEDATFLETTLPEEEGTTKTYSSSYDWVDDDGNLVDVPKVMQIKIRKQDVDGYNGGEEVDYTQGDATLKGAVFSIYRYDPDTDDYTEYVYDITVDHQDSDGYWCAESDDLAVGKYMVVEKVKSTKTGTDGVTYNYSYAEGYLVGDGVNSVVMYFDQDPSDQEVRVTYHTDLALNQVERGSVEVIKYDENGKVYSSDKAASEGAILRLTLNSNTSIYYDVVINKNGYGNFLDTNDDTHSTSVSTCYGYGYYPYTIPYGTYTITEVKASNSGENTYFYTQPEVVEVTEENTQKEYRIVADNPVPAYLKIVKYDADTEEVVHLAGAVFKIWSVDDDDWVTFYTQYQEITELHITTDDGYLVTPQQLQPGTYVVYEVSAPDGYYLEDSLRPPADENNLGNTEYGGVEVVVDKLATGLSEDAQYPEGGDTSNLYIEVDISDRPLKAQIQIYKTGEVLTSSTSSNTDYGEKYTPVWEEKGLEGVTFDIIATEDIMSPDGTVTYVEAGTVVDTVTTGEDGYATTDELYLGTYSIVETDTPDGYLIDDDIEDVTLENDNELVRVELEKKELTNTRQKLELTFKKIFEDVIYSVTDEVEQTAVFGVYTNKDIYNYANSKIISKDSLVDVITVTGDESYATSTIDLPEGTYYVKELEASYPYKVSDKVQYFTLKYTTDDTREFVVVEGEEVENESEPGTITLIKISTSTADDVTLYGSAIDTTGLDDKISQIIDDIAGLTKSEIETYLEENNIKFVAGATYKVYIDEDCTKVLKVLNESTGEYEEATFVTDDTGMLTIENIPTGTYYFKEISAPKGYTVSGEVVEVTITSADLDATIYQALIDNPIVGKVITKTDIFTGDVVPDCTFEITDEEGNVLVHAVTDEEGNAYIPVDIFEDGKTYFYTEIDAPDIYELNTEAHEFVAQIDEETGDWIAEPIKVENIRKTSTVTLIKLDLVDSTPIPNCKFELRSLETDFVVEGVTDENGIYVFENIPYGEYTYTELEAPEEYQIDTTPHEITIDAEEITIQVTNQLVDTSDIQVVTLSIVLVVSILGVAYTLKKKKITN